MIDENFNAISTELAKEVTGIIKKKTFKESIIAAKKESIQCRQAYVMNSTNLLVLVLFGCCVWQSVVLYSAGMVGAAGVLGIACIALAHIAISRIYFMIRFSHLRTLFCLSLLKEQMVIQGFEKLFDEIPSAHKELIELAAAVSTYIENQPLEDTDESVI